MNYEKLYFAFIDKYKNQEFEDGTYTEVHHIIPRHAGGDDSKENLIRLDYKQHIFAHHLLWKTYKKSCDYMAWLMMRGQEVDQKIARGKANVESGLLAEIRLLANTPVRQEKLKLLHARMIEDGTLSRSIQKAQEVWTGSNHTEEFKKKRSEDYKIKYTDPVLLEDLMKRQKLASAKRTENAEKLSLELIVNAERNEEFLQESSSRSKNKFISPEGLEFDSPILAAKYYGNVEYYIIENWCKRNKYGWSRKPKAA
jgi:hypothetical protein